MRRHHDCSVVWLGLGGISGGGTTDGVQQDEAGNGHAVAEAEERSGETRRK